MNTFALTVDPRRYDVAKKTGLIELIGIAERNGYHIAEMRGTITHVTLYAKDRQSMTAEFSGSSEADRKITVRWEK